MHKSIRGEDINILVEAVSIEPISPEEVRGLEIELSDEIGKVNLYIWYRSDAVITGESYRSFEDYNEINIFRLEQRLRKWNLKED